MGDFSGWAEHLKHPLVLVGFVMLLLSSYLKFFYKKESTGPKVVKGYTVFLFLSVIIVITGLVLAFKQVNTSVDQQATPSKHTDLVQRTSGDNSPAIWADGDVTIKYETSKEALESLKGKDKVVERLLKTLEEKDVAIEGKDQVIKDWVAKYQELEGKLTERADTDDFAAKAKERLEEGDLEGAEKFLMQSYESNIAGLDEQRKAAAVDAYEIAELKVLKLEYREALPYYEQAARLEPENFRYLNEYGYFLYTLGEPEKAIGYFAQALEILKTTYGDKHPYVATTLNNIGSAWHALGEARKAIGYYEQSLEIDKAAYGDKHPKVATRLNNIGEAWRVLGKPQKAIEYYEQALEIDKAAYGDKHPEVALRLNNIGGAWHALGEPERALEYFEQALEIKKNAYGENHPSVATTLNNIGGAWDSLGEPRKAIGYYEQALEIIRASYGEEHPYAQNLIEKLEQLRSELE